MPVLDQYQRPLRDLRISVTDRCNFRCTYCMPKEIFGKKHTFLPKSELLTFEEITRLARILVTLGVRKIRLTGGEPLLRAEIEKLIAMLAEIPEIEIAMTTNGSLLGRKVETLRAAGLDRATISLDALDDATFRAMNDVNFPVHIVLESIAAAEEAGLTPLKINMVVKRGVNDKDIIPMARYFHGSGNILRFIEFMDVGSTNRWRMDQVVPAKEILEQVHAVLPIAPLDANYRGEVANRWRYQDGGGEIGIIASVTQPFCGDCTRLRLSAKGEIFTCLFGIHGHDLRALVRGGASDEEIRQKIISIWQVRQDNYSEARASGDADMPKVEMSYIGG